jgi:hypothetical protein
MGIIGQMRNVVWIICRKDKHDGRFYLFIIILQQNKSVHKWFVSFNIVDIGIICIFRSDAGTMMPSTAS